MSASRIAVAVAVLGLAGAAHAESPVPANYIDRFGSITPSSAAVQEVRPAAHGSPVAANYVDDFGSLVPRSVGERADSEELGAASGEPGRAGSTVTAQWSADAAAAEAYQHDRFVRQVWERP